MLLRLFSRGRAQSGGGVAGGHRTDRPLQPRASTLLPCSIRGHSRRRARVPHAGVPAAPIGPLDGVPCTVKDLLDLAGFPTRRGSRLTSTASAKEDAPAVMAVKNAGAVIVGKTTTTEYGWKTPGGLSAARHHPQPVEPGPDDRGILVGGRGRRGAACFGPLHIGTDAGGSVRLPAAWCGLVGLKPTFGRIPQWPLGAFANVGCRRADDPHGRGLRADAGDVGPVRPARPVLPSG